MDTRELTSHLLEVLDDAAYRLAARRVTAVHLEIGAKRSIDVDELHRTFAAAARGTVADGAQLSVQLLPCKRHCRACGTTFEDTSAAAQACPSCGHPRTEDISGEELRVVKIVVEDRAGDAAA